MLCQSLSLRCKWPYLVRLNVNPDPNLVTEIPRENDHIWRNIIQNHNQKINSYNCAHLYITIHIMFEWIIYLRIILHTWNKKYYSFVQLNFVSNLSKFNFCFFLSPSLIHMHQQIFVSKNTSFLYRVWFLNEVQWQYQMFKTLEHPRQHHTISFTTRMLY